MSQRRMVKLFLDGFQVPSLQYLHQIIRTNPDYSENFENCVTYISETLLATGIEKTVNNSRTVAAVDTERDTNPNGKRHRGRGNGRGGNGRKKQRTGKRDRPDGADRYDPRNPTQWLKPEVFKALPEETKKKIQQAHAAKRDANNKRKREAKEVETSRLTSAAERTNLAPAAATHPSPSGAEPAPILRPMSAGNSAVKHSVHCRRNFQMAIL